MFKEEFLKKVMIIIENVYEGDLLRFILFDIIYKIGEERIKSIIIRN